MGETDSLQKSIVVLFWPKRRQIVCVVPDLLGMTRMAPVASISHWRYRASRRVSDAPGDSSGAQGRRARAAAVHTHVLVALQPPAPVTPWRGALNCSSPGFVCPQIPYYSQTGLERQSEDCLNLNIYSPHKVRPVAEPKHPQKQPLGTRVAGSKFIC